MIDRLREDSYIPYELDSPRLVLEKKRTDAESPDLRSSAAEEELAGVDQAVKAHEQAHMAVLGGYAAGNIQYDYLIGPDGSRYAVGGSIKVDLQPVPGDPEATIRKAQALIRASLAPGSPSGADLRVAAEAYRMQMHAVRELEAQRAEEESGSAGRFELFA